VEYVTDICTKKDDNFIRGTKNAMSKQKFRLNKKQRELIKNKIEGMSKDESVIDLTKDFVNGAPVK
jgi:hypothetical protein